MGQIYFGAPAGKWVRFTSALTRMQKGGPDVNDMSASVFLVSHILFELHAKRRGTNSFAIDLDDFAHAITILQLAIEREIVTRVIRVNDGNNDSGFLAAMKTIKCTSE